MDVTDDVTCTLRAEAHHPPCVLEQAVFENHSQDTRYKGPLETAPTVNATYGMGGNNQPFVVETPKTLKIRAGGGNGGKGALIQDDKSATLSCSNDQTLFVPFCKGTRPHSAEDAPTWKDGEVANTLNTFDIGENRCNELVVQAYGICSKESNAMKSGNPHSGFYETDTSRTLDANGGNPSCNQGGIAVVAVQGSMIGREDKNGPQGSGGNEDVCFSLTGADRHAVAYPTYCTSKNSHFTRAEKELANTLVATGMRISEFCGLTLRDIDLENKVINIDHQLQRTSAMKLVIESTKTNAGTRKLPMTEDVAQCFRSIIEDREEPEYERVVEGYAGFLFTDKNGYPEVAMHWEHRFNHMVKRYNDIYRVQMPNITPHVCRHTYCSNMAKSGMNPKTLQYLMGHSDIGVTLNTYTHLGLEDATDELRRMEDLENARKELEKNKEEKPVSQKMFRAI